MCFLTREIYYDNSATTRTREEAARLVYEMLTDCYGNPSSLHRKGFAAQQRLEQALMTPDTDEYYNAAAL